MPEHPDDTSDAVRRATESGMEAFLVAEAAGAGEEEAFAAALGRAVERYLDSLEPEDRLRLMVRLHPRGQLIPEGRMLPTDPEELAAARKAARRLAEAGKLRRLRDARPGPGLGRVYWLRPGTGESD